MGSGIPFHMEITFAYGAAAALTPRIRRFVSRNPGKLTYKGTNLYIIGRGEVTLIDAGPDDPAHIDELLAALPGERISRILLTHSHRDHSGGLRRLRARTGAELCAFAPGAAPRGAYGAAGETGAMHREFADASVRPDIALADGDVIEGEGWRIEAVHTPGHAPDHLCYAVMEDKALITGDHIMGWSTSVIAPPEGHMGDYLASLQKLLDRSDEMLMPGHGGRIRQPRRLIKAYLMHRQWRENSICDALRDGLRDAAGIMPVIYKELAPDLRRAATLSVLAHLEHLVEKGIARQLDQALDLKCRFELV